MTALAIDKPRGRAWWKELWIQVLIAMAAGIALGIVNPEGAPGCSRLATPSSRRSGC